MLHLIKSSLIVTSSQLLVNLILILRMKYLAVSLGPEGLGVFSLISSFFSFLAGILYSWLNTMVTKFIASSDIIDNQDQKDFIIGISMNICLICSLIGVIPIIIFSGFIRDTFLSKDVSILFIILYAGTFVFGGLSSQLSSYLHGLQRFSDMAKSRLLSSFMNLFGVVFFVYFWGLTGFFLSLILATMVNLLILLKISKPKISFRIKLNPKNQKLVSRMIKFSGTNILLAFIYLGSFYFLRKLIVDNLGVDKLGLFFAAFGFASQLGILAQGMNYYSVSQLSKEMFSEEKLAEMNNYLYLSFLFVTPVCTIAIVFQNIIAQLFYSKAFLLMNSFFYLLILCQFFASITCIFDVFLWTGEKNKEHAIVTIINHGGGLIFSWLLLKSYGLIGVGVGLLTALLISQIVSYVLMKRVLDFTFRANVFYLMIASTIAVVTAVFIKDTAIIVKVPFVCMSILALLLFVEKKHMEKIKLKFGSLFDSNK